MADQPKNTGNAVRTQAPSREYTFHLTLPRLVFSLLFGALLLTWIFIFGIMLGRGHAPEKDVPQLADMMPSPPPPVAVLRPEDLSYHDTLKGRAVAVQTPKPAVVARPKADSRDARPPIAPGPPDSASVRPKAAARTTKNATAAATRNATTVAPRHVAPVATRNASSAKPPPPVAQKTNRFQYLYQVASFKEKKQADSMHMKLQNSGLKSHVESLQDSGGVWHRVLVSFTGAAQDTRLLREKLEQHGIRVIIMREKKPAS